MPRLRTVAVAAPLVLLVAACAGGGAGSTPPGGAETGGTPSGAGGEAALQVVASFYPLEYLAQRVAGDHAEISTLTAPGIDPHDVELSPRTVGSLGSSDLVIYESGMQPAVDDAVAQQAPDHSFDVTPVADLLAIGESVDEHEEHADESVHTDGDHGPEESGDDHTEESGDDHTEESGDQHAEESEAHDHGAEDPHFWLDPQRYGDVATALAEELVTLDPRNADSYRSNAAALVSDLDRLDEDFSSGLAQCESRQVVTTHEAFGYLGARYDLEVTGITGISPESEPSPARLAEVSELVRTLEVSTVYTEPLLSPAIARTVATETGAQVLTLDPADGLSDPGAGSDYLDIMRSNLQTLREGQGCS